MNVQYTTMNIRINLKYASSHSWKYTELASSSSIGVH